MWIMTTDGFYSTVKKPDQTDALTVRARVKKDLENLLDKLKLGVEIRTGVGTDYPYRITIKQEEWAEYLHKAAMDIGYSNCKDSLALSDNNRHYVYFRCWEALMLLEEKGI